MSDKQEDTQEEEEPRRGDGDCLTGTAKLVLLFITVAYTVMRLVWA